MQAGSVACRFTIWPRLYFGAVRFHVMAMSGEMAGKELRCLLCVLFPALTNTKGARELRKSFLNRSYTVYLRSL